MNTFLQELQFIASQEKDSYLAAFISDSLKPKTQEEALFYFLLWKYKELGHLCLSAEADFSFFQEYAPLMKAVLKNPKEFLQKELISFVSKDEKTPEKPICIWKDKIYFQKNWIIESLIFQKLQSLHKGCSLKNTDKLSFLLGQNTSLEKKQKEAILQALNSSFSVILGGPGTGKSYTISALISLLASQENPSKVAVAAPTGKAIHQLQKKMDESFLSKVAMTTVHRLLDARPEKLFLFDERPLPYDMVIVDESAMIDAPLMAALLQRIGEKTHLVLVGDPNQLPPIELGSVFHDLAKLNLYTTHLEKAKRFEEVELESFSKAIASGSFSETMQEISKAQNIHFSPTKDPKDFALTFSEVKEEYFSLYGLCQSEKDLMKFTQKWQLLSAHKEGFFGANKINEEFFSSALEKNGTVYLPIIITMNDYVKELYNGMQGVWIKDQSNPGQDQLYFPDRKECYLPVSNCKKRGKALFELAFCLSVHKSQGSEFDRVDLFLQEGSEVFGRNLLYSAATRAKKQLHILSSEETMEKMLKKTTWRDSGLVERFNS